ncbi:hypothetical protein [Desulfocicer vacuolatum]|uniref:hypothetical protein n=1 Tax=Desulfocicer vacuolatum TaxID=2298 RepID=UPI001BB05C9E|nr:hypothetical protein [Desulfocicer vacuolatum]
MKHSINQRCISSFVVGRPRPEYGLPVAVYKKYSANRGCISRALLGVGDLFLICLQPG